MSQELTAQPYRYRFMLETYVRPEIAQAVRQHLSHAATLLGVSVPPIRWLLIDRYGPLKFGGDLVYGNCHLDYGGLAIDIVVDTPADMLADVCYHEMRHAWQYTQQKRISEREAEWDAQSWTACQLSAQLAK